MGNGTAQLYTQEELVAKVLQIREESKDQGFYMTNLILWFAAERITKKQKHLIFTGLYQRHDKYGNLFTMGEMLSMWHQCEMMDYVDPNLIPCAMPASYRQILRHLHPVTPDWCIESVEAA